eukprot:scaffold127551_cov22-Cyclotella_meneghiniana.AAC.2
MLSARESLNGTYFNIIIHSHSVPSSKGYIRSFQDTISTSTHLQLNANQVQPTKSKINQEQNQPRSTSKIKTNQEQIEPRAKQPRTRAERAKSKPVCLLQGTAYPSSSHR